MHCLRLHYQSSRVKKVCTAIASRNLQRHFLKTSISIKPVNFLKLWSKKLKMTSFWDPMLKRSVDLRSYTFLKSKADFKSKATILTHSARNTISTRLIKLWARFTWIWLKSVWSCRQMDRGRRWFRSKAVSSMSRARFRARRRSFWSAQKNWTSILSAKSKSWRRLELTWPLLKLMMPDVSSKLELRVMSAQIKDLLTSFDNE